MEFIAKTFDELSSKEVYEILKSRAEIFLLEQNIVCQDMDDVDYKSMHFFLWNKERAVAYLRAFPTEEDNESFVIGRVLTLDHRAGMGTVLMENSMKELKRRFNAKKISVHSQEQAMEFYRKFGFVEVSDKYLEEGVVHITMEMNV